MMNLKNQKVKINSNIFLGFNFILVVIAIVCALCNIPFNPLGYIVFGLGVTSFIIFLLLLINKK